MSRHIFSLILASTILATSACTTRMSGKAQDDSLLSGETKQLESAGSVYTGPEYSIGIVRFDNKVPAKVSGVGEAAATILKKQLETVGLEAILLDENLLQQKEKLITLQQSGINKTGQEDTGDGFDAPDYRLSGEITAYSEVEEGIDTIVFQKITVVARVAVDYALIDITTGKSLMVESGAGEYRKTSTGTSRLGARYSFDPSLRDGALRDALSKATEKVIHKLSAVPFQGKILAVDNQSVVLKAGSRSQLKNGTQLDVYHVDEALRDPDSGKILGYKESKVGIIQINNHQNRNLSGASIVSGSGFQVGDIVKQIP